MNFYPGPNNLYAISNAAQFGLRTAMTASSGRQVAFASVVLLIGLGLGPLLLEAPHVFLALKIAGALFIAWLGVKLLLSKPEAGLQGGEPMADPLGAFLATLDRFRALPEDTLVLTLKDGDVVIALRPDLAPKNVAQIKALVREGAYNNVAFHRVIDGFMAQTGDVRYDDPVLALPWGTLPEGYCRNYADGATNCPWRFDPNPPGDSPTKEQPRGRDYMGGDLKGVDQYLDYLQSLGVTALYFNPIFDAASNHGYDTQDYYRIDPYLGTQKVLTVGAAYDMQSDVAYANYGGRSDIKDYKAWTVDAFMEYPAPSGVYTLSGAYFKYDTDNAINGLDPDPGLGVNSDLKGWYVKGGYMLPGKVGMGRLQFFARHEKSDYGVKTGLAEYYDQKWNGVGANYYIDGQKLKVTFEYADVSFDTEHPTNPALQDYKQATLGLQFIF